MKGIVKLRDGAWVIQRESIGEDGLYFDIIYTEIHPDEHNSNYESKKYQEVEFEIVDEGIKKYAKIIPTIKKEITWNDITNEWLEYCDNHVGEENHIKYGQWLRENYNPPTKK